MSERSKIGRQRSVIVAHEQLHPEGRQSQKSGGDSVALFRAPEMGVTRWGEANGCASFKTMPRAPGSPSDPKLPMSAQTRCSTGNADVGISTTRAHNVQVWQRLSFGQTH